MSTTSDFESCQHYVINSIENVKQQLNQCQLNLIKQSEQCSSITLPLDRIDSCLRTIVDHERKYLSIRNDHKLLRFKDQIHEKELATLISTYSLSMNVVSL